MPRFETDKWPFIQARHFKKIDGPPRRIRVICIHDMEAPEKGETAENVAKYFTDPRKAPTQKQKERGELGDEILASAHICVDSDSIIQCVHDRDVAYAAPGCNNDGIQIELAGYGKQSRDEWLDNYGVLLLNKAADAVAQYCLKFGIPAVHLSDADIGKGQSGIVGHAQVSRVYKKSDHQDPGPNFPWDYFLAGVRAHVAQRRAVA